MANIKLVDDMVDALARAYGLGGDVKYQATLEMPSMLPPPGQCEADILLGKNTLSKIAAGRDYTGWGRAPSPMRLMSVIIGIAGAAYFAFKG